MTYETFKNRYKIKLNTQQEAAVKKVDGPVLLLAVPGSGKTTVLVTRLGYMIYSCGIRPDEILTMTYTVAATKDMQSRFLSFFGDEYINAIEFRTINSVSAQIIQYFKKTKNRQGLELISNESALSKIISDIYKEVTSNFANESDIKSIRTAITYIKNMLLSDDEIEKLEIDSVKVGLIYSRYTDILRSRRWMDFDDQMVYAYQILIQCPDILDHFQQKYRYYCVDEAQDTSKIQHLIIRLLASKHQNLFMVGDEDQSIYGFRAAYPEALIEFDKEYNNADILLMETNYRSTKQIIELADRFIQANKNRHPKHMTTLNTNGISPRKIDLFDRKTQYSYLAKMALNCNIETAILYRDNECIIPLIDLLNRQGIGYRCKQLDCLFFSHFIVQDITNIIKFAHDPMSAELFLQLYYKFNAGINKEAAYAAIEQSRINGQLILDVLQESGGFSPRSKSIIKGLQTHLMNIQTDTAERVVYKIVHYMGYSEYLERRGSDKNKIHILLTLASYVQTPLQLLERLDSLFNIVKEGTTDDKSKLTLSTIHSSKGLEYDRVILIDIFDGMLPKAVVQNYNNASPDEIKVYEEERRLLYVAMTRAKRELLIFNYNSKDIVSEFMKVLFPKEQKQASIPDTDTAPQIIKKIPLQDVINIAKDYIPNLHIKHKSFGTGYIKEKDNNVVTIIFDDGNIKRIDLITALQHNLLKLDIHSAIPQ